MVQIRRSRSRELRPLRYYDRFVFSTYAHRRYGGVKNNNSDDKNNSSDQSCHTVVGLLTLAWKTSGVHVLCTHPHIKRLEQTLPSTVHHNTAKVTVSPMFRNKKLTKMYCNLLISIWTS